jgi:hypothetical protein
MSPTINTKLACSVLSKHGLVGVLTTTSVAATATNLALAGTFVQSVSSASNDTIGCYQQRRMLSSTELQTKSGIQQPNRLTTIYQRMKDECPADLKAYAVCVEQANSNDELGLQQGSCQNEFSKVQDCFQRTRTATARTTTNSRPNCITF